MAKVLIIDDDPISRRIIARTISSLGHQTIEASDGKIGFQVLQDNKDIELLVTDFMMPRIDGRKLVKLVRGHEIFRNIPVIMISGIISLKEISAILDFGAIRFLPKPVDITDLKLYTMALLDERKTVSTQAILDII